MTEFQPTIPAVYGEPIEVIDVSYERDTDRMFRIVNSHAKQVEMEQKAQEEKAGKQSKLAEKLTVVAFSLVVFFTTVGITTVYHWFFG